MRAISVACVRSIAPQRTAEPAVLPQPALGSRRNQGVSKKTHSLARCLRLGGVVFCTRLVGFLLALTPILASRHAWAGPADDDEPLLNPWLELDPRYEDPDPPNGGRLMSPLRAPIWIGVGGSIIGKKAGDTTFGTMLMLGLPLERLAAWGVRRDVVAEEAMASLEKPSRANGSTEDTPPPKLSAPSGEHPEARAPSSPAAPPIQRIPVTITTAVAHAAVDAALRRAHLLDPSARPDDLAARARAAAALPELRLRVLRTVDSGAALSPTEYDPTRTTDTATIAFWLEARATWRLDRLIFAEEEVALERMRHERTDAQSRLTSHVLRLLFEWQRGLALTESGVVPPDERLPLALRCLELEAELDLVTDGWFSKWRARSTVRELTEKSTWSH